jgi:hypothetical protein
MVDICAPGVYIWSTISKLGRYGAPYGMNDYASGTSMATPYVVGVIAKIWSQCRDCTHTQVEKCLKYTADFDGLIGNYPTAYGSGLVQAEGAYKCLQDPTAGACC